MSGWKNVFRFGVFLVAAFALSYVPYFRVPAEWYGTLFHELSHGIMAVITGGHASKLNLHFDGSGTLWHSGGWNTGVAFAGYAGATAWGVLIYTAASRVRPGGAVFISRTLAGICLLLMVTLASVQDATVPILVFISAGFIAAGSMRIRRFAVPVLQLAGAYVTVTGMFAPTRLFGMQSEDNDAKTLSNLTGLPETFWIIVWLVTGALCVAGGLLVEWKRGKHYSKGSL